jgi:hypothetical protein
MPHFRKKPVVIEAWQNNAYDTVPQWVKDASRSIPGGRREIVTLEGTMTAESSDWIIKGVKGEVYPCKPDIFTATYDEVDRVIVEAFLPHCSKP